MPGRSTRHWSNKKISSRIGYNFEGRTRRTYVEADTTIPAAGLTGALAYWLATLAA